MVATNEGHEVWQTTVDGSGRVLVPAELRHAMHAEKGTTLLWIKSSNGLQLATFEQSLAEIQKYYQRLSPKDDVWTEDLIARRKQEAAHE